jgi:hypothetical protein
LVDCPELRRAMVAQGLGHVFAVGGEPDAKAPAAQMKAQNQRKGNWQKGIPGAIVTSLHATPRSGTARGRRRRPTTGCATPRLGRATPSSTSRTPSPAAPGATGRAASPSILATGPSGPPARRVPRASENMLIRRLILGIQSATGDPAVGARPCGDSLFLKMGKVLHSPVMTSPTPEQPAAPCPTF